jgi:hypothetical protein
MSRKHRRTNHKKNFPWLIIGLGSLLVIVAVFLFANRGGGDGGGTPVIAVDQQKIDYGYVKFGNNKSFKINVSNNGNGLLRFKKNPYVEVLEGC